MSLSSDDLYSALLPVRHFRGVFAKNSLPKEIKSSEITVINLDNSSGPGTHWVCIFNDPKKQSIEYFDSFGAPPPENVLRYMKKSGKTVIYNSSQLQDFASDMCGYWCLYYINARSHKIPPLNVLMRFSNDTHKNEKILLDWVRRVKPIK